MDKYGPIGDDGVCLLAANALIFRRFWRIYIDSIVVGLHLGVQMRVSKRSPLTPYQGLCSWTPLGDRPQAPVIGSRSVLAMCPVPCPSLEKKSYGPTCRCRTLHLLFSGGYRIVKGEDRLGDVGTAPGYIHSRIPGSGGGYFEPKTPYEKRESVSRAPEA